MSPLGIARIIIFTLFVIFSSLATSAAGLGLIHWLVQSGDL